MGHGALGCDGEWEFVRVAASGLVESQCSICGAKKYDRVPPDEKCYWHRNGKCRWIGFGMTDCVPGRCRGCKK